MLNVLIRYDAKASANLYLSKNLKNISIKEFNDRLISND